MTAPPTEYLMQEIRDMLGAGDVALWELPISLRLGYPDLPWADELRHSREVLQELLETGEAKLVWCVWAKFDLTRDAIGVLPDDEAFQWPSQDPADLEKPYLAVEPIVAPQPEKKHFWSRKKSAW